MNKKTIQVTTTCTYNQEEFDLIREVENLRLFINTDSTYAIIVNSQNQVLFELKAFCSQNVGFLDDAVSQ
jgi:hypothetical protein